MTIKRITIGAFALAIILVFSSYGCFSTNNSQLSDNVNGVISQDATVSQAATFDPANIPNYAGEASASVNEGTPFFSDEDLSRDSFEMYSTLDSLGRCGMAYALVGPETMPDEKRGSIGMIKPSGWQISKYDWIDGKYLFNRCHLIAYALTGENDNPLNLITGTRSMNAQGMLPYEEQTMYYVRETGNHVLYRVTPVFAGDNLVASGVLMEAESVEDKGAGIKFCVWCYNVEPGVVIDYATGDNRIGDPVQERYDGSLVEPNSDSAPSNSSSRFEGGNSGSVTSDDSETSTYVLNTKTRRFHLPGCKSVSEMKEKNRRAFEGKRSDLVAQGYKPCGICKP